MYSNKGTVCERVHELISVNSLYMQSCTWKERANTKWVKSRRSVRGVRLWDVKDYYHILLNALVSSYLCLFSPSTRPPLPQSHQ